MLRKTLLSCALGAAIALGSTPLLAADYMIDTKGAHAFIQFKVKHLGYSWLLGRFNEFSGEFSYDEKDPSKAKISVDIKTASVDSNHAERDKHLRGKHFLDVSQYPDAKFVSTGFEEKGDGKAVLKGDFTFHGVTKNITIDVEHIGAGDDPWGGYRRGFEGITRIALNDFGIKHSLGEKSEEVELQLFIEGIRK